MFPATQYERNSLELDMVGDSEASGCCRGRQRRSRRRRSWSTYVHDGTVCRERYAADVALLLLSEQMGQKGLSTRLSGLWPPTKYKGDNCERGWSDYDRLTLVAVPPVVRDIKICHTPEQQATD